jgi:hypothetical protein
MLPLDLPLDGGMVAWSTAEVADRHDDGITLRLTGEMDAILLRLDGTGRMIVPGEGYTVEPRDGGDVLVTSMIRGTGEELLRLHW